MRLKTVTVYQCDVCKRTTGVFQNTQGVDIVSRCIITQDCKGTLHKIGEKQQPFLEASSPDPNGLEDWSQRPSYFKHTQQTPLRTWRIKHDLNGHPSVRTFVEQTSSVFTIQNTSPTVDGYFKIDGNFTGAFKPGVKFVLKKISGTEIGLSVITSSYDPATDTTSIRSREPITLLSIVGGAGNDLIVLGTNTTKTLVNVCPLTTTFVSPSQVDITFADPVSGVAECLIRNITQVIVEDAVTVLPTLRQLVSINSIISIATRESTSSLSFDLQFISPRNNKESVRRTMTFTLDQLYLSPWSNIAKTVLVNGQKYYVRAVNLTSLFQGIEDNSNFYIKASSINPGNIGTSIILLSNPPHQNVDKDPSSWVNMSDVTVASISNTLYANGILSCTTDLFNTAFPLIRTLS